MKDDSGLQHQEWRWPNQRGPWSVRLTYGIADGRLQILGVEMWAVDDPELRAKDLVTKPRGRVGITTVDIRLPLRQLLDEIGLSWSRRASMYTAFVAEGKDTPPWAEDAQRAANAAKLARRRGRKPRYNEAHFRAVAEVYKNALRTGLRPTKAVAQSRDLGGPISYSAAAKWVAQARDRGFLPTTTTQGASSAS